MTIANAETVRPSVTRTHCPYCAFQCGMTITTSDSKSTQAAKLGDHVIEIAPDDFPVNRGQMCIKGYTAGELLTDPARILSPLCRDEAGQLIPVTWEQAFGFVTKQITELKAKRGPDAIAAFGSGALTNEKGYLLGKFARVALGTSNIDYNGRYCMSSARLPKTKLLESIAAFLSPSAISLVAKPLFYGDRIVRKPFRRLCSGLKNSV